MPKKQGVTKLAHSVQVRMKERSQQKPPQIISELNTNLGSNEVTVESIAEKVGISRITLYGWVKHDSEFLEALEIIKEVQNDDPFKLGGEEDFRINEMIITFLLLETNERLYKPHK